MSNYLPNPPEVIDLAKPETDAEKLWREQGGLDHKFAYRLSDGSITTGTVNYYEFLREINNDRGLKIERLEQMLTEAMRNGEDSVDVEDIANLFGISLERQVSFDVMVRFTGTLTIPFSEDIEMALEDMTYDMSTNYGTGGMTLDYLDCDVQSVDWSDN